MPGRERARRDGEDRLPAVTGYQAGQCRQPEPVRGLVADRAGELAAQYCVLMPEHEQLGILCCVAAQQHPGDAQQLAGQLVQHRSEHADMVPAEIARPLLPAATAFRARQAAATRAAQDGGEAPRGDDSEDGASMTLP